MKFLCLSLSLFTALPALATPPADSPLRLLDLRHLARLPENPPFVVDAWTAADRAETAGNGLFVLAHIEGGGVVHHFMGAGAGRWVIEADGRELFDGSGQDWRHTALQASREGPGEHPWAWPLAMRTPNALHCVLPIPFAVRLRVLADQASARLWLAGERLSAPPARRFGDPVWTAEADAARRFLGTIHDDSRRAPPVESWQGIYPLHGSEARHFEAVPGPGERAGLLTLEGAGEIVGMRFEFGLPFFNRLRYLLAEITPDGEPEPTLRMPLVDLLGNAHPFFQLWNLTHGTWVNGLQHPAWHEPWMTGWFRLPVPFSNGLRIDLVNRHPDLPQHVRVRVQLAPLGAEEAKRALRLCGMRHERELPLADGETAELMRFRHDGRLVLLSLFSTGHDRIGPWASNVHLTLTDGEGLPAAAGFPFFPMAGSPFHAKPINLTWSQPHYGASTWLSGSRTFWLDPVPISGGMRLAYRGGGEGGPTRGEAAVLWYQRAPYAAPPVGDAPPVLPERRQDAPPAEAPGGWSVEAEDLLPRAVAASGGDVYVERRLALDAQASGDALLAWNAPFTGAALDLFVSTPPTPYVRVWVRAPGVPGGGRFDLRLVPANRVAVDPLWPLGADDFARRSRGDAPLENAVDAYARAPMQRLQRHYPTVALHNPVPGGMARLRFVSAGRERGLLVADQIVMNPSPPLPPGWRELHDTAVRAPAGTNVEPMPIGRNDFHGDGGLRLAAAGAAVIRIPLRAPVPLHAGNVLLLRGHVARGNWTAGVAADEGYDLGPAGATSEWPLAPAARNGDSLVRELVVATPAGGELLLNAWRVADGDPP